MTDATRSQVRENPADFDAALARRDLAPMSSDILGLDESRRAKILAAETAQAERNAASKEVGQAKARGDEAEFQRLRDLVAAKKTEIAGLGKSIKAIEKLIKADKWPTTGMYTHTARDATQGLVTRVEEPEFNTAAEAREAIEWSRATIVRCSTRGRRGSVPGHTQTNAPAQRDTCHPHDDPVPTRDRQPGPQRGLGRL